jgi:hypothetical protein
VVGDDSRKRSSAVRFSRLGRRRLDAREQDLAAIGKMKAAAVDDIGDMAFALRRKRASFARTDSPSAMTSRIAPSMMAAPRAGEVVADETMTPCSHSFVHSA